MNNTDDFETRLATRDLSLFSNVPTQSTVGDRQSWLAVQSAIRGGADGYVYLEIGSHLGGSIQQHLIDPRCRRIYSIDKRPLRQPDDSRGFCPYEGNSTERMLEHLRAFAPESVSRVTTFDGDASEIDPARITEAPHLCFIDGEHTKSAVRSDFDFCRRVARADAVICFHDDFIIYPAIQEIVWSLEEQRVSFTARKLGGGTFAIILGRPEGEAALRELGTCGLAFLRRHRLHDLAVGWIPVSWRKTIGDGVKRAYKNARQRR